MVRCDRFVGLAAVAIQFPSQRDKPEGNVPEWRGRSPVVSPRIRMTSNLFPNMCFYEFLGRGDGETGAAQLHDLRKCSKKCVAPAASLPQTLIAVGRASRRLSSSCPTSHEYF